VSTTRAAVRFFEHFKPKALYEINNTPLQKRFCFGFHFDEFSVILFGS
jgi:hypothetical protein